MKLRFDRFHFDRDEHRLEDASGAVDLNPKAFEVLAVLLQRRGQLVSKDALLDAVWPDAHVADGVLKVSIAELRRALGDSATSPRYIETVHRRGYRFIAEAESPDDGGSDQTAGPERSPIVWPVGGVPTEPAIGLVGRGGEIEILEGCLARALAGERQVVFVTGEAGAGKTALVEHFVAGAAARRSVAITGSQCLEQFGSAEAYMPILEAVGRLARAHGAVQPLLRRYAPTWLAQLPWLIEDDEREKLGRELVGSARERMLREMAEMVEALTAELPLVVVLDDLHWSDPSTIDLLALVAGRREPARLLVIATYRPAEVVLSGHPLRAVAQRLATSRRCTEVTLDDLAVDSIAEYLERRFAGNRFPSEVARLVRKRTDGNPLFLVTLVDHLLARGAIVERDRQWQVAKELRDELAAVPESLRRLIEQRLDHLQADDRELLRAASLVGVEFSAAAAAAGAGVDAADAEEHCARLAASGPLLRATGSVTWPDGTVAAGFAFRHPLYREALAASVAARRRADMHQRIGTILERAHGERSSQLAAELALHFEEGGDRTKAIGYRRLAALVAADRHAFAEAESHLEKGVAVLATLPASAERDRDELALQSMLGSVRMATRGYAAPEVGGAFTRALALSSGAEGPSAFPVLWGIWLFYAVSGELDRALELAERNRVIAYASDDSLLRLEAHHGLWTTHFFRGELDEALHHLDAGEPLFEPAHQRAALVYGQDPKMAACGYRSLVMWARGHADRAVALSRMGLEHALALGHPMTVAQAMVFAGWVRLCRREPDACREHAEAVIAYCTEHALPFWFPNALQLRGWALVELGEREAGMAEWRRGVELWTAARGSLGRTAYDALFVEAVARAGDLTEARSLLERCKSVVATTGERYHEADIHRLDAELLLGEAGGVDAAPRTTRAKADALLQRALDCARRQGARAFELRAATSRLRLLASGPGAAEARARLTDLVATFTEGRDLPDVQDARRLLA